MIAYLIEGASGIYWCGRNIGNNSLDNSPKPGINWGVTGRLCISFVYDQPSLRLVIKPHKNLTYK